MRAPDTADTADDPHGVALCILGGGPAAMAAARGFRAVRGTGRIAMVADEGRLPYRRPPLTKELLRREMTADELPLADDRWPVSHGVELVTEHAMTLDLAARTVGLASGRTIAWERCVLATGAEPERLPVPGTDDPGVRVLRSYGDFLALEAALRPDARVVVVGSGFIGCEIAASLRARGLPVCLVTDEEVPQGTRLGDEVGTRIATWLRADGVDLRPGHAITAFERCSGTVHVLRDDAGTVDGDVVVMATGVRPRIELALAAGLDCPEGAVPVDPSLRTAADAVWAAGDVCMARHALAGRPLRVEHWGDALTQGELAGRSAAGDPGACWDEVPGFWSSIGTRTLKYAAWGDGFATVQAVAHAQGTFTVTYRDACGELVGVLTHGRDEDHDRGRRLIGEVARRRLPAQAAG